MLSMHDLPFQFIEYEGIRAIFEYLHPDITLVSRNTSKADVLKLYANEKSKMRNILDTCHGVCVTSNCWISLTTYGYISTLSFH